MKNKLMVLSGFVLAGLAPIAAFAQTTGTFGQPNGVRLTNCSGVTLGTVEGIICKIGDFFTLLVPILITFAVLMFIYGVIMFVIADDEEAKTKGRDRIIYGIIGFAVIIALWGLVKLLTRTFGIDTGNQNINYPTVPY